MFSVFNLKYILQKVCQRDKDLMLKGMSIYQVGEKCAKAHILRAESHTFPQIQSFYFILFKESAFCFTAFKSFGSK